MDLERGHRQFRQLEARLHVALEREKNLHQRRSAGTSFRLRDFHHRFVRQVRMVICCQRDVADAPEQLAETWVARKVRAQHDGIDEKPDDALEFRAIAIRDGRSDDHVSSSGVPVQQGLERREQHHERCYLLTPAQGVDRSRLSVRDEEVIALAGKGAAGRPGMICGYVEGRRRQMELLPPVRGVVGKGSASKMFVLPDRKVGILKRGLSEERSVMPASCVVDRRQLSKEDGDRPSVSHDMMECDE
ncbi:MAG: hypothetical protein M3N49_00170 [Candidatus Eremiobacteraeota bacterium]|nr:hypothetical protein [Candidatus Eremiobacteraeota bacterium]